MCKDGPIGKLHGHQGMIERSPNGIRCRLHASPEFSRKTDQ